MANVEVHYLFFFSSSGLVKENWLLKFEVHFVLPLHSSFLVPLECVPSVLVCHSLNKAAVEGHKNLTTLSDVWPGRPLITGCESRRLQNACKYVSVCFVCSCTHLCCCVTLLLCWQWSCLYWLWLCESALWAPLFWFIILLLEREKSRKKSKYEEEMNDRWTESAWAQLSNFFLQLLQVEALQEENSRLQMSISLGLATSLFGPQAATLCRYVWDSMRCVL